MKATTLALSLSCLLAVPPAFSQGLSRSQSVEFERIVLNRDFCGEGACFADINGDGDQDVVSGAFWYEGPTFRQRHQYAAGGPDDGAYPIVGYSDFFFVFSDDFDGDGDTDVLSIPMPGTPAFWHENPGAVTRKKWKRRIVLDNVGGESPALLDIDGDGRPELVCIHNGKWGYAQPHWKPSDQPWKFSSVSEDRGLGRFTHGLGVDDVNSDGRPDLLERTGWWEQVEANFVFHKFPFAQSGGSQMFAYDFDGDGDQDVVSVQNAHAWGLSWFERRGEGTDVSFIAHEILPPHEPKDAQRGAGPPTLSQMHALALADIDGDGIKDIVTGKRYFAHNGNDPGAKQLPLLVWFRTIRDAGSVRFEPNVIAKVAGVGTQLTVEDMNGDGRPDIVVGNKLGTSVFINRGLSKQEPIEEPIALTSSDRRIGSDEFNLGVRKSEPLSPADELSSFVLPPGFKAELVVAEPDIAKPMNLAFDARGRLWVSSSLEYPFAAPKDRKGRDTIQVLEDTTGDGRYDKVTTFADGLNIPIGLYPYKDGVVCFSIPNIWFLRDTDGDGVCDKREVLFGPMGFERDTHGMCNAFTRGHDGWLYACHGFNNHTTVAGRDGHEIRMQSGNTFRMRLDGSRIEHYTHGQVNPFGLVFDEYGDAFTADCHTKPVTLLMQNGYYESFGKPHDGLGFVPNAMEHLHGSTAIGGIAYIDDKSWPVEFQGNTFGGNVMTSRINRNSLQRTGSTVRAREEPDFLMSGDPWFRPVDLQLGPDGSLYVADFYNRIIGHYEVDLKHPGRDRTSGRVWRISYVGDRKTANSTITDVHNLNGTSARQLVRMLARANLPLRKLIEDRLADHLGNRAIVAALEGLDSKDANTRIHCAWVLVRLGHNPFRKIGQDKDDRVRTHLVRMAGEGKQDPIASGLIDTSNMVVRASAMAAMVRPDKSFIRRLLIAWHEAPPHDVHLRHALRMALREHLKNEDWFQETMAAVEQQDVPVLAGICLALRTERAGEFLARNLDRIPTASPKELTDYLSFAAKYVSADSVDLVVDAATKHVPDNIDLQLQLLHSIDSSLAERGGARPDSVTRWAESLAKKLLALDDENTVEPLSWQFVALPDSQTQSNPWQVSTKRNSADGEQKSRLLSSFPTGEKQTGVYRSAQFELGETFSFWMAGHDGFPDKPHQNKNFVRLRDANTHTILKTWLPPRNDTAQRFELPPGSQTGKRVYVELVDGDAANAYAWLAVGRFSLGALNPVKGVHDRTKGIELIGRMKLTSLRDRLAELLERPGFGRETISKAAVAFASFESRAEFTVVGESLGFANLPQTLRTNCLTALRELNLAAARELIPQLMKSATQQEQSLAASILAGSRETAPLLLEMFENGHMSLRLLQSNVRNQLKSLADQDIDQRVTVLIKDLPDENIELDRLIQSRTAGYLAKPGDLSRGIAVFKKNCAACHQVAGVGAKVGPNLDGIGTRGLNRLMEDVLAPNRNVDINFRSTTLLTDEGKVITGLLRPSAGAVTTIVNSEGKEITIPTEEIDEQRTSRLSPMPEGVAARIPPAEFRDLMAYLLSLGG